MSIILPYDTETTGLPLWNDPSGDPRQPHLVQLGACLVNDETRKTITTLDVMIKPDGWTIPAEVSDIHGITTEMAGDLGVHEALAVEMLLDMWSDGRRERLAHNESFDARILRIAIKRYFGDQVADEWKAGRAMCTQKMASPIMKMPATPAMRAARRFGHKPPKLSEAVEYFTGEPLRNAHTALADVRGCMAVFFAIRARDAVPA